MNNKTLLNAVSRSIHYRYRGRVPLFLTWFITRRCNLSCQDCVFFDRTDNQTNDMTTASALRAASRIAEAKIPFVIYAGGEPLIREDLWEIAEALYREGTSNWLFTNGILLADPMLDPLHRFFDKIYFSVDGLEPYHEKNRGKGTYQGTLDAIRRVRGARLRTQICVFSILNRDNIHTLPQFLEEMRREGVEKIRIQPDFILQSMPEARSTAEMARETTKIIRKYPGYFQGGIGYLEELEAYIRTRTFPKCGADSYLHLALHQDGRVSLCCLHHVFIGNILERPLVQLIQEKQKQGPAEELKSCPGCFRSDYNTLDYLLKTPVYKMGRRYVSTFLRYL